MKDILVQHYAITDFVVGSPREVLKESYKVNLISDDVWMEMLRIRNELFHDYDSEIVKEHYHTIVKKYIDLFLEFEETNKIFWGALLNGWKVIASYFMQFSIFHPLGLDNDY